MGKARQADEDMEKRLFSGQQIVGDRKWVDGIEYVWDGEQLVKKGAYNKASLLDTAKETIAGRGKNYGTPEDNFARIAGHWARFLLNRYGVTPTLTPGDVAIMMALMKIARLENDPKHADSWIDLAGYAACGCEIETTGKP